MRGRFGRRRIFDSRVVVALGIGALAVIVLSRRRRATEESARRELRRTTREREAREERQRRHDTEATEPMSDELKAEAESTQLATQELPERIKQRGRDEANEVVVQVIEETEKSMGEDIREAKSAIRLRPLSGQPMMSVIRETARRRRRGT